MSANSLNQGIQHHLGAGLTLLHVAVVAVVARVLFARPGSKALAKNDEKSWKKLEPPAGL